MPSDWGARKGMPGYDKFRTGLSYGEVRSMLRDSEKHRQRHTSPHDRRHTVLGFWHELKLQLYELAVDRGYEGEDEK
jgi:hypothetical protein